MKVAKNRKSYFREMILIFLICFLFRFIEYLFIKTDQTFFAENFIHKVLGIIVLFVSLRKLDISFEKIGFIRGRLLKNTLLGLIIGLSIYSVAYAYEYLSLSVSNPQFQVFVTAYSLDGNYGNNTSALAIIMCVVFNIINVIMEEGIFRGLFMNFSGKTNSFWKANIVSALFFGLWHIAMPVISVLNGERSMFGGVMMSLFYIATTFLMALALGCWYKITGSLWFGMAYHFVNNAIVNLLHIVTNSGTDEMLSIRLAITQTIFSFVTFIAFVFWRKISSPATRKHTIQN